MTHIAICGMAQSRKFLNTDLVYREGGQVWGLPWDPLADMYDVLFEMHDRSLFERRGEDYVNYLRECDRPIYMQEEHPDIPNSVEYPLQWVVTCFGDYFNSSIAYMLGVAGARGQGTKVSVWGVDNHEGEEWAYERPCNEYMIGRLMEHGVEVTVHHTSSLLKFNPDVLYLDERQHYVRRYGWLKERDPFE